MAVKKYAEIVAGKVKNISMWEEGTAPVGFMDVEDIPACQMGATHNGGNSFTKKAPPKVGVITITPKVNGKPEVNLGGEVTVSIEAKTNKYPDGVRQAGFNGSRNISIVTAEGALIRPKFTFVNGVAVRQFTPTVVGVYKIQRLPNKSEVQLVGDMTLDVLTV
tara:strand:- start:2107 stop:2595 length:489 start_codon:yes stop_codon:yes gene_type:complete